MTVNEAMNLIKEIDNLDEPENIGENVGNEDLVDFDEARILNALYNPPIDKEG